jgi:hypothetical protein
MVATAEVKIIKRLDEDRKCVTMRSVDDRDFWMTMRHALLMQLAIIERKLGIYRRCKHCGGNL